MAETQLQILSDLHLEAPDAYDVFQIEPKAPYLALLGDIGYIRDEGFFRFLRKQLQVFRVVFLVIGNHEPYFINWREAKSRIERFRAGLDQPGQFVLLDKTRYDISPTTTILGCTLFSNVVQEQKESVSYGLNDFYHIRNWSVESHQEAHRSDLEWLNGEIEALSNLEPHRKVVVLSHYCPLTSEAVIDPQHKGSKISSGFMTDLSNERCWKSPAVKLWAFGHTHFNCDFRDGNGKRVAANQAGYYFAQAEGFNSSKIFDV
ncbi:hypothetical protein NQ176_g539 [Zarea fungicola]|uniref:Uncharacterized protein n=1 Tax=Zarea fungicola TaxID=93591 RepID=A0ACC1NYZ7_9HYPO|nr:hypothetical protein NQ176_g539 [Lecanicillium fungicola]